MYSLQLNEHFPIELLSEIRACKQYIAVMMYTTLYIIYMYIVRRVIILMTLIDRSSIIGIMFILIFYKSF